MKTLPHTWLVVCDSTHCMVYEYTKEDLTVLKKIEHLENKLRDIDITSDKPGRYESSGHAHGTYSQETDPKEIHLEKWAKEITKMLQHEHNVHAYKHLILAASPHMHGLLLKNMDKHVAPLIAHAIGKNLVHLTDTELLTYVKEEVKHH